MKQPSHQFCEAAGDYLYMLDRGYPQKAILKIIGDRYSLSGVERSMLYRGISACANAANRRKKISVASVLPGSHLHIDACNVLITIGSYLNGSVVFISNDGMLRDASEIHGKVFRSELVLKSLEMIVSFCADNKPKSVNFYIDSPVSYSGMVASTIRQLLDRNLLSGSAETFHSPDFILKNIVNGIIASSDTIIMDHTTCKIVDLPYLILKERFNPPFPDLGIFVR